MRILLMLIAILVLGGCDKVTITKGDSINANDLESFFRKHKVDGNYPAALKKHSAGESYLATIHGYPNNLSVCEQLIEPYNKDMKMSVVPGDYYCEELR